MLFAVLFTSVAALEYLQVLLLPTIERDTFWSPSLGSLGVVRQSLAGRSAGVESGWGSASEGYRLLALGGWRREGNPERIRNVRSLHTFRVISLLCGSDCTKTFLFGS